ncbi:hypothetical protein AB0E77_33140 [Streptomyces sp. NPDC032940]|uniref:hypothetical protein n=1 Tax=Streptomyces sp. NPDC032940 TaxID=3155366 RepID=UPI003405B892
MRRRTLALMMSGVLGAVLMTATTTQAATRVAESPQAPSCQITAWGHVVPVVCRDNAYVNADWTGDGIRDEVFFISPPNNYVYRISAGSNGPVRVSDGKAWAMVGTEKRPTGYHRVYAATAGGTVIYAQQEDSVWTPWFVYEP